MTQLVIVYAHWDYYHYDGPICMAGALLDETGEGGTGADEGERS